MFLPLQKHQDPLVALTLTTVYLGALVAVVRSIRYIYEYHKAFINSFLFRIIHTYLYAPSRNQTGDLTICLSLNLNMENKTSQPPQPDNSPACL